MEPRTLTCDGQLVATAEVADTYGYDRDQYDHIFLFKHERRGLVSDDYLEIVEVALTSRIDWSVDEERRGPERRL